MKVRNALSWFRSPASRIILIPGVERCGCPRERAVECWDPGRSSYQIALTVCEGCRRAKQQGRGELIEVGPEVLEMAECDGQHIGYVHDDVDARAHVGAIPPRATQTIPPKIRRAILRRDAGRCRVPGCRHAVFTDVHHLALRSEEGKHSPENLVTLCAADHRAIHDGVLIVTGSASSQLEFTHADGTPYGGAVAPAVAGIPDFAAVEKKPASASRVFGPNTGGAFRRSKMTPR